MLARTMFTTTAVIGAGIAGLAAARMLRDAGDRVVVFDKGRGPGGRAARRRDHGFAFDHGAQYFTARDRRFVREVERWSDSGVVETWNGRLVWLGGDGPHPAPRADRYVGVPGMSAVARHLGDGLEVHYRRHVSMVRRSSAGWMLRFDDGAEAGHFSRLIVTAPAPQTASLLQEVAPHLAARAAAVRMLPCWAVMAAFERRLEVDFDAAFVQLPGPIRWIARDSSKPGRSAVETWVVHAGAEWSAARLERPHHRVARRLTAELARIAGLGDVTPVHANAHRWRHAFVDTPIGAPCLIDADVALAAAGDWCIAPRLEAAYLSGAAAAARLRGA